MSLTYAFKVKHPGHSVFLFCWSLKKQAKNFLIQEVAHLQFTYWPVSAFDGNWCRLGCYRLSRQFFPALENVLRSTEGKPPILYEWKVLLLVLCFRWDDWETKKIVVFLEDLNISTWNTDHSLPFTYAIVCCLPLPWYFITLCSACEQLHASTFVVKPHAGGKLQPFP